MTDITDNQKVKGSKLALISINIFLVTETKKLTSTVKKNGYGKSGRETK